jgi:hypothetical protein
MRPAAKASLILCVIGGLVHLALVLVRSESRSLGDLPIYVYFAGPYVIVGVLSWWRRDRPRISRWLLAIAVLVSLSGIVAAAQYRGVESVGPFVVTFVHWLVLGVLIMILTLIADLHRRQPLSNRDIACNFVKAFCRGDVETVELMLAGACRVQDPRGTWDNRALYVAGLRRDPPTERRYRLLSVTEDEHEISVFYELLHESVIVAQLFRVRDGLIVGMLQVSSERATGSWPPVSAPGDERLAAGPLSH